MSRTGAATGSLVGPQAMLAAVAELDRAELHAIENEDWIGLGEVLARQRQLWQELASAGGTPEALSALRSLYHVRRRNHALIAARAAALRERLLAAQETNTAADATLSHRE